MTAIACLFVVPLAVLTACGTDEQADEQTTSPTATAPPDTERLTTQLKTPDGTAVANATFDFADGYATVTVDTVADGILTPGFHGLHVHAVGKCEANSVAPPAGGPADFASAGSHFQAPGHTGHPASGDLTSLQVRPNGAARLVTTTDAYTAEDLLSGDGTALMIHEGSDNFANIPQRYTQPNGTPGPDEDTLATGDAGSRVACGVIGGSAGATGTATTTTTPAPAPAPVPAPGTEPTVTTEGATTTSPSPETTVTTTTPTTTTVTTPPTMTTSPPAGP